MNTPVDNLSVGSHIVPMTHTHIDDYMGVPEQGREVLNLNFLLCVMSIISALPGNLKIEAIAL